MDLKRTAREVLENVGGEENIISIMSCFTRVRVELKDKTKVDEKKLKEADGCQGVNWVGNTVQIIFGGPQKRRSQCHANISTYFLSLQITDQFLRHR